MGEDGGPPLFQVSVENLVFSAATASEAWQRATRRPVRSPTYLALLEYKTRRGSGCATHALYTRPLYATHALSTPQAPQLSLGELSLKASRPPADSAEG
jgi:hypothetical protein